MTALVISREADCSNGKGTAVNLGDVESTGNGDNDHNNITSNINVIVSKREISIIILLMIVRQLRALMVL